MKKVTVRMVGAAAGVSHATVSRVLNNDPRVHPSTRLAVIRAAQQFRQTLPRWKELWLRYGWCLW